MSLEFQHNKLRVCRIPSCISSSKNAPLVIALKFQPFNAFSPLCSYQLQISSVTSMSFLTEQNLTFHRFSDGTITCDVKKNPLGDPQPPIWATNASMDYSATNPTLMANESATSATKILPSTIDDSIDRTDGGKKRYSAYSVGNNSTISSTANNTTHNGSTMKLIQVQKDDNDSKQVSNCSQCVTHNERGSLLVSRFQRN
jgi:hypothetical protein